MEGKCSGARTNCAVSALVLGSPTPPASHRRRATPLDLSVPHPPAESRGGRNGAGGRAGAGMSKGLIGKKVGMTTVFGEDGTAVPVTVIEVPPNLVLAHRTADRDGYTALQLAHGELDEKRAKRARKPDAGVY